jgi:succinate-acetate transporter protein
MSERIVTLKDTTANPAPLGLLAFGMTTILLNLHNAGLFGVGSMIMAMGIFYGGLAQIIAGVMEWKKNNTFGTTAFTSYGFFWLSLVAIWLMPRIVSGGQPIAMAPELSGLVAYLVIWGVLSAVLFIGTLRMSRALQIVFALLVVLFFMLAIGDALESPMIKRLAGIEGIICGASAMYTGLAQVLNEVYGRTVMPLGAPKVATVKAEKEAAVALETQTA